MRKAKKLKITWFTTAAENDRKNVVDLQARILTASDKASAALSLVQNCDVVSGKSATVCELLGSSSSRSSTPKLLQSFWIGQLPSFENLPRLFAVLFVPALRFGTVAARIFGSTFSRPFGFESWPRFLPALIGSSRTHDAEAIGSPAFGTMSVLAWLAGIVSRFASLARREALWMFRLLCGPSLAGFTHAGGAAIICYRALRDMTIPTQFACEVISFASGNGGLSFRASFQRSLRVQSTMLIVSVA
jgi:hypothetical protein